MKTLNSAADAFEATPIPLLLSAGDGSILFRNGLAREWLEAGEGSLLGHSLLDIFVDDLDFRQLQLMLAHENGTINVERRLQALSGRRYWVSIDVRRFAADGCCLWMLKDISATHRELEALHLENRRFRHMLDASAEGYVLFDTHTYKVREVNPAFCQLLGLSADEIVGRLITAFTHSSTLELQQQRLTQLLEMPQQSYELRLQGAARQLLDVQISSTTLFDDNRAPLCVVALVVDITERKKNEERILYLALYDNLTSLPNRILLEERLQQALRERQRRDGLMGLLFLDLDNFKQINDTLGHDIGDGLLQALARRLHQVVRKSDTVARLGGDEFIVLLPDLAGRAAAAQVAAKLLQASQSAYVIKGHALQVSCSIGIGIAPDDGDNGTQLKQQADKAMYIAKSRGKNQFAFCPQDPIHDPAV